MMVVRNHIGPIELRASAEKISCLFTEDDVVIDPKEFPDIDIGDILEIYHPDENDSHLLVQVKSFKTTLQQKDIISIEQGIAGLFKLRAYKPVCVEKVDPSEVALDLVELVFKEQYISRSDMWKLKNTLLKSSLHYHQNINLLGIRAQVVDLWAEGLKVTCGVVSSDTRVSFRSSTAMVNIYIQMSSEMWEFDTCGDLYMEKAVNGFLTEIFEKWNKKNIFHEVTIVLFSRTQYEAQSLEDIPAAARHRMHTDYGGKIYEDFYRVVAQNVRSDDWRPFLTTIKRVVQSYERDIQHHIDQVQGMPKGVTSKASQGNFLEAINMAMNVFDNHYINRNFDRTGQLVIVVTPGAGVFEADRALNDVTKQRIIDYGIGSDLVCLAEQPPHAVPLIVFQDAVGKDVSYTEKYNIVHWLNYSFYFSPSQKRMLASSKSSFIPRMRVPERLVPQCDDEPPSLPRIQTPHPVIAYQEREGLIDVDEDEIYREYDRKIFQTPAVSCKKLDQLVNNPFSPSTLKVKLTSERRRWTHAFPHGPLGEVIQTHHKLAGSIYMTPDVDTVDAFISPSSSGMSLDSLSDSETNLMSPIVADSRRRVGCAWGITGEQAWSPFLETGMDWKSLTTTCCFPISTDFFPDNTSLQTEYFESPYTMDSPVEENETLNRDILWEIFQELISQRLIQDFQLVIIPEAELNSLGQRWGNYMPLVTDQSKNEFVMSCGSTFHKLTLNKELRNITVVRYMSRNTDFNLRIKKSYHFSVYAAGMSGYQPAQTKVYHKSLEDDWNYRDNYICRECPQMNDEDFEFNEKLKFWSSRYLLLPACITTIKKLQEEEYAGPFDVFPARDEFVQRQLINGFFKFAEILNKKRAQVKQPKPSKETPTAKRKLSQAGLSGGGASTPPAKPHMPHTVSAPSLQMALHGMAVKDEAHGSSGNMHHPEGLTKKSPLQEIAALMKEDSAGVNMLSSEQCHFPPHTFLSHDAVEWVQENVDTDLTLAEATSILTSMVHNNYIQPLFPTKENSSNFLYGYYLYYIPQPDGTQTGKTNAPSQMPRQDPWFEAACVPPREEPSSEAEEKQWPRYKRMEFEVGNSSSSKRSWRCQLGFHEYYNSNEAFEIELQWVTSSPLALNETIHNWVRRVLQFGLHLVPAIIDPFGSQEDISDPMKQILFIPLRVPGWISDQDEIGRIQKAVLARFGFISHKTIKCVSVTRRCDLRECDYNAQYVHVTGHAFVALASSQGQDSQDSGTTRSSKCLCGQIHSEPIKSERDDSAEDRESHHGDNTAGFHWIRNTILCRRWKMQATGDERLHDALLADFIRFCANDGCRLERAIDEMVAAESMEDFEEDMIIIGGRDLETLEEIDERDIPVQDN